MAIQNILPDPNNKINAAGEVDVAGSAGPGFASVKLASDQNIMRSRTNSGRVVTRAQSYHKWNINISYNPMTQAEFLPVYTFLLEKQGSLNPFFVSLPQYRNQVATNRSTTASQVAGAYTLSCSTTDIAVGNLFTITDSNHSDHTKAYMVTRVGASDITFTPALAKEVSNGATIVFTNPLIKVVQTSDLQEYSLQSSNLYSFSLQLEEASY